MDGSAGLALLAGSKSSGQVHYTDLCRRLGDFKNDGSSSTRVRARGKGRTIKIICSAH